MPCGSAAVVLQAREVAPLCSLAASRFLSLPSIRNLPLLETSGGHASATMAACQSGRQTTVVEPGDMVLWLEDDKDFVAQHPERHQRGFGEFGAQLACVCQSTTQQQQAFAFDAEPVQRATLGLKYCEVRDLPEVTNVTQTMYQAHMKAYAEDRQALLSKPREVITMHVDGSRLEDPVPPIFQMSGGGHCEQQPGLGFSTLFVGAPADSELSEVLAVKTGLKNCKQALEHQQFDPSITEVVFKTDCEGALRYINGHSIAANVSPDKRLHATECRALLQDLNEQLDVEVCKARGHQTEATADADKDGNDRAHAAAMAASVSSVVVLPPLGGRPHVSEAAAQRALQQLQALQYCKGRNVGPFRQQYSRSGYPRRQLTFNQAIRGKHMKEAEKQWPGRCKRW